MKTRTATFFKEAAIVTAFALVLGHVPAEAATDYDKEQDKAIASNAFNIKHGQNELEDRIIGTEAAMHALSNSMPNVRDGETGIGFGLGGAIGAQAAAFSFAEDHNNGWSTSTTMTMTFGASKEVSGGFGIQYKFK